jgi:hypothetical protein
MNLQWNRNGFGANWQWTWNAVAPDHECSGGGIEGVLKLTGSGRGTQLHRTTSAAVVESKGF